MSKMTRELFDAACKAVKAGTKTRYAIAGTGVNRTDFYIFVNADKRRKRKWVHCVKWRSAGPEERVAMLNEKARMLVDDALDHVDAQDLAAKAKFADVAKLSGAEPRTAQGSGSATYIQHNDNSQHVHVERRITRSVVFSPEPIMERFELLDLDELDRSNAERQKAIEARQNSEAKQVQHEAEADVRDRIKDMREKTQGADTHAGLPGKPAVKRSA